MAANITLEDVILPGDMRWDDEFKWTKIKQVITPSVRGNLLVQANALQAGRYITLIGQMEGKVGFAMAQRSVIDQLRALESSAMPVMTLTLLDDRTFPVLFRYTEGPAIESEPMKHKAPQIDTDYYSLKLSLIVVE